jgi:hypothetical protein
MFPSLLHHWHQSKCIKAVAYLLLRSYLPRAEEVQNLSFCLSVPSIYHTIYQYIQSICICIVTSCSLPIRYTAKDILLQALSYSTFMAASFRSPRPVHIGPRTYLRILWADLFWLATISLLTAGIFFTPVFHFARRGVPYRNSVIRTSPPDVHLPIEISYTYEKPPLPSWFCGCLVFAVPMIVIASFQIKIKSLWDWHCGMTGTLKALVAT